MIFYSLAGEVEPGNFPHVNSSTMKATARLLGNFPHVNSSAMKATARLPREGYPLLAQLLAEAYGRTPYGSFHIHLLSCKYDASGCVIFRMAELLTKIP